MEEKEAPKEVKKYQCLGCISEGKGCYECDTDGDISCSKHISGTFTNYAGKIFLGMPKGFNRLGCNRLQRINIFENYSNMKINWGYDKLNVPVTTGGLY